MNNAEKIILPVLKHFVLLQRSKVQNGVKSVGSKVGLFYTHTKRLSHWLGECGTGNSHRVSFGTQNNSNQAFFIECSKHQNNEHTASNDGGKDRNRKSPCLHSLGAQIHRTKHYQQHLIGTRCLLRRELQYQGVARHTGRLRDGSVGNVNELIVCHQDNGAGLHRRLAL